MELSACQSIIFFNTCTWLRNGYLSFSGNTFGREESAYYDEGVHNTPLLIIGEAGVFTFLYFIWIYGGFLAKGIRMYKNEPLIFLVSFSLFMYMLTNHNYFNNYLILFVSIWLWMKVDRKEIILEGKMIKSI